MPTFYVLRDGRKTRGPMDADSARLLLSELGAAGVGIAEVRPEAAGAEPAFTPAAEHPLWTERRAPAARHAAAPWLTTETSGWPDAERLGIVGAERVGRLGEAPALRADVLAALTTEAAELGADAVVAVALRVSPHGGGALLVAATGTALRLG